MSKREERAKNARLAPANSTDPVLIVKAKAAADEVKSVKARWKATQAAVQETERATPPVHVEAQATEQAEQEACAEEAQEAKEDDDMLGILADKEFAMILQEADVKARSLKVQIDAVKEEENP